MINPEEVQGGEALPGKGTGYLVDVALLGCSREWL